MFETDVLGIDSILDIDIIDNPSKSKGISKGRRFPGHMGLDHVVLHGLKIWRINPKYNVIYVHGHAIPGCINSYVRIYDTGIKRHRQEMLSNPPPMPTSYKCQKDETFASDIFKFNAPSIKFSAKNN
ncbi:hypothetical protein A3Q56_06751 [Intoshia linei]|uniref:Large ribosomal subunit protein uL3m n=1 Tax=Intoshia linei TaxID=1819745 RepID=A0A177AVT5_9BILA|nr:hypothetical protein A3Q56_06751 [Intoshia linei]